MLTNDDLKKIGQVIDNKLDSRFDKFEERNDGILDKKFNDFGKEVDKKLDLMFEKELKPIKRDLSYIKKTLDIAIGRFDETGVNHEKRLKKIEDHLDFPETN